MYIGQSIRLEKRFQEHIDDSLVPEEVWKANKRGQQTHLHRAIRKYGAENFSYEIIEECLAEQLNDREIYWIAYYNTFLSKENYNMTAGGDGQKGCRGELSSSNILSQEDVNFIKQKLKERWTAKQIQECVPLASNSTISNINYGISWRDENEKYPLSINNGHRLWSDEQAMTIKNEYANGMTVTELSQKYNVNLHTIQDLINGKSYINLPIIKRKVNYKRKYEKIRIFTPEEVQKYRKIVKEQGVSILSTYNKYGKDKCNYSAFYNMIKGITYKDIL